MQVAGYVNAGQLQYYFKVDTAYVRRRLGLLLFPVLPAVRGRAWGQASALSLSLSLLNSQCVPR